MAGDSRTTNTDIPHTIPLVNGKIHLHWVKNAFATYKWTVISNIRIALCGTPRCMFLEISTNEYKALGCEHHFIPPEFGQLICEHCHEVREFKIKLPEVGDERDPKWLRGEEDMGDLMVRDTPQRR